MKKIALFAAAAVLACMSFGSAQAAEDWNVLAQNDHSQTSTLGGMASAKNKGGNGSSIGIQTNGAVASLSGTSYTKNPLVPTQKANVTAQNTFSTTGTVGLIWTAKNVGGKGSSVFIGTNGAAASVAFTHF